MEKADEITRQAIEDAKILDEHVENEKKKIANYIKSDEVLHSKYDLSILNMEGINLDDVVRNIYVNYKIDEVLGHLADDDIKRLLDVEKTRVQSVDKNAKKEEVNKQPAKESKKILVSKKVLALGAAGVVAGTVLVGGLVAANFKQYKVNQTSNYVGISLGEQATGVSKSLVEQYKKSYYSYELGTTITDYDYDGIAKGIISICEENPQYFDVTLGNTYFEIENILPSMDKILKSLKNNLKDNEEMSYLYDYIKDYDVFLEYLADKNLLGSEYSEVLQIVISDYKEFGYDGLSEEEQEIITKLRNIYKKQINGLEFAYKDQLNNSNDLDQSDVVSMTNLDELLQEEEVNRGR